MEYVPPLSAIFTKYERKPCNSTPECDGPVRQPPRNMPTFILKYRPYSCATRSAAAFEAPKSECSVRSNQFFDGGAIANIHVRMCKPLGHTFQPFEIPKRVARRSEENSAHVVVHAKNFVPLPVEMLDRFRANQSAASRD